MRRLYPDRDVGDREDAQSLLHAELPKLTLVVEPRSVGDKAWPERKNLHRLRDRVSRRAGSIGDDCEILAREGVYERRLAGVAQSEECDANAVCLRSLVQKRHRSVAEVGLSRDLARTVVAREERVGEAAVGRLREPAHDRDDDEARKHRDRARVDRVHLRAGP